ncbi:3-deoxy-D-manno-octulosonic acid transferase [Flavilitoribacter nigricans]|uniref:3-deoxy-D-manno-octulosonic acid transferase n=1 Tax=Flavilitoribacter nigricans TaxID=70997 RepID=UPI001472F54F|nr:glycosyltransferase N-terminal domain-containing protein [Flavilitoribacter nigricans]
MITFLYTLGIYLYTAGIRLAAIWNEKARQWISGRQRIWQQLETFKATAPEGVPRIWIHCASLGEFEQGRPLIEKIKARHPEVQLILTFFSPSGYEIRKNYPQADLICYLPVDTPGRTRRFVQELRPDLAIFVKYEFWYHHLHALDRAGIPTLLISAIFRPSQIFFRSYGFWYRRLLTHFRHIFTQDSNSGQLLQSIGVQHFSRAGDTRVDRVLQLREQAPTFPEIARFRGDAPVWIAGSSWPVDEALLFPFWEATLPANWKLIIAPHDIAADHIEQIEQNCKWPSVRYSQLGETETAARVLIIDNIGMLSALYQYGRIAYIGGGFGKAIHNLLEPIAFGLPVLFGPKHEKFQEALALKRSGGGFAIEGREDLDAAFEQLRQDDAYAEASRQALAYLQENQGSTDKILQYLDTHFPTLFEPRASH